MFGREIGEKSKLERVLAREYATFSINKIQPYRIYSANPLISCSVYYFRYKTPNNEEKAIFYHALSGNPAQIEFIVSTITKDNTPLKEVSVTITFPGDEKIEKENKMELELQKIKEAGFTMPFKIIYGIPFYHADNRGNHGMVLRPEVEDYEMRAKKSFMKKG